MKKNQKNLNLLEFKPKNIQKGCPNSLRIVWRFLLTKYFFGKTLKAYEILRKNIWAILWEMLFTSRERNIGTKQLFKKSWEICSDSEGKRFGRVCRTHNLRRMGNFESFGKKRYADLYYKWNAEGEHEKAENG